MRRFLATFFLASLFSSSVMADAKSHEANIESLTVEFSLRSKMREKITLKPSAGGMLLTVNKKTKLLQPVVYKKLMEPIPLEQIKLAKSDPICGAGPTWWVRINQGDSKMFCRNRAIQDLLLQFERRVGLLARSH